MSTFLGSTTSGILIDETQLVLISGGNNAIKLLSNSNEVDFGAYSLTNLGAMQADLNMNGHKIIGVSTPVDLQDAANKNYVDTAISNLVAAAPGVLDTLNELASALENDANFSVTITNALALKFNIADFNSTFAARYAATSITDALPQTGDYSANDNKITDVKAPTADKDAANKKYVDDTVGALNLAQIITVSGDNKIVVDDTDNKATFTNDNVTTMVLDTVSLRPTVPIDMNNSQKIVGVMDATDKLDAMNLGQSLRHQWIQASLSADITSGFTSTYTVPFNNVTQPGSLNTPVTNSVSNSSGTLALSPGKYLVTLMLACQYDEATSQPVNMSFYGASTGASPLLNIITNRAHAFDTQIFTQTSAVLDIASQEDFTLRLQNTTYLTRIDRNTKVLVQRIY